MRFLTGDAVCTIIADDLHLCIELVSTAIALTYSRVILINCVRLPNLLVVSCIRGKYIYMYWYKAVLLFVLVYIPGISIFFIWGHVHSCTVHCCFIVILCIHIYIYTCNYSGMCM